MRRIVLLSLVSLSLAACGGSGGGDDEGPRFSQNVNNIPYALDEVRIRAEIEMEESSQTFQNELLSEDQISAERVRRVTIEDRYELFINDLQADIEVASSANIDREARLPEEDLQGCRRFGTASNKGFANYDEFELNYRLEYHLEGKDCPESEAQKYRDTILEELGALHLIGVQKLIDADVLEVDGSRRVKIEIWLSGESTDR